METRNCKRGGRVWTLFMVGACAAVVMIRTAPVRSEEALGDNAEPSQDLDYVCIADAAVSLHPAEMERFDRSENRLLVRFETARRRCRPPLVPVPEPSKFLGAAMDFDSGYGGMLTRVDQDRFRAIAETAALLKRAGWRETPASERVRGIKKQSTARVFERDGAWLFAVTVEASVPATSSERRSAVFVAGQWHPSILEML